MQVSNVLPGQPTASAPAQPVFNTASMDVDMDLDISLDVGEDGEAMNIESHQPYLPPADDDFGDLADEDEGAIPEDQDIPLGPDQQLAPEKVHIRGLDNLTTDDVKAFVAEHSDIDFTRLEWIDDTSANIVYDSPEIAISVLSSLVDPVNPIDESSDAYELRTAKPLASHRSTSLNVRLALTTDVKKPRAREASRFYLMNPEYDPLERRRQRQTERGDRRGYGDRRQNRRRRDDDPDIPFDESMYDEEPPMEPQISDNRSRRRPRSQDRPRRRGGDLFADRIKPPTGDDRLRDRSASPSRDGDGRFGFIEDHDHDHDIPAKRRIRQRSSSPPSRRPRSPAKGNASKELMDFTRGRRSSALQPAAGKELFPAKSSSVEPSAGKELFPRKAAHGNHRRKGAFDAGDETADLFADQLIKRSPELRSRSLADRITGGPPAKSTGPKAPSALEGINIRGAASQPLEGFSIRGSALGVNNPKVKELFPDKAESGGTNNGDLFEGRISGRGGQRRRAQDLF